MRSTRLFSALFLVTALVACGGAGGFGDGDHRSSGPPPPTATPSPTPVPVPGQRLYAAERANCGTGSTCTFSVNIFDLLLYPNSTPSVQLTVPPGFSIGNIAVDSNGNLAACSFGANGGNVLVYSAPLAPGNAPSAVLNVTCGALAFDRGGKLYVPTLAGAVKVFSPPFASSSTPSQIVSTGLGNATGVAFDASENLFVSDAVAAKIFAYAPPYSGAPAYAIAGTFGALRGLAFDAAGNLYASDLGKNGSTGSVHVFKAPIGAASVVAFDITSGINSPQQLAVDVRGNLYVASVASIGTLVMYAPPMSAASAPAFTLGAHFNSSIGTAVGP